MKKLLAVALGIALGAGGLALAQTYSVFSYLRVLNVADVRTSIQNQDAAESVVVDDNFSVTGTSSFTGAITVPSCTGCGGGGAPTTADYLVGTADGTLSNEIVVGATPGGELGGTWASPTLDDNLTVSGWTIGTPAFTGTMTGGSSGGIDMTPESGEFTATFDTACTTSPTVDFDYQRIGNLVVVKMDASTGFSCTSDSTSFSTTGTPAPASIRPTNQNAVCPIMIGFTDNGASTSAYLSISTAGIVSFTRMTVSGANIQVGSWTNSGSKSAANALGGGCAYMLGNP